MTRHVVALCKLYYHYYYNYDYYYYTLGVKDPEGFGKN